ncbi:hypothetical protein [Nocardia sp. NPDC056000]|uniref:hypothetical protein n=1 Tax=Nocardia sp. NPDC056000 TaxID=3345674 RepID=UPI0035D5B0DE
MRADLLALTDDSLITLANRGIFKRAVKENTATPPEVTESADGTVEAVFPDGTRTTLTPGITLEAAPCTCGSTTICRHRIMAVLAYRTVAADSGDSHGTNADLGTTIAESGADTGDQAPAANIIDSSVEIAAATTGTADDAPSTVSPPTAPWSPAAFTDDELRELLGARAFTAAKKALRAGYRATVRRATDRDPVPAVELSAVTVRFLVPGELGYARADASKGARPDAIALAVWAFRLADTLDPAADTLEVTVGDSADGSTAVAAAATVLTPLADLLNDGVAHAGPALPAVFSAALRTLDSASARWPHDALTELLDQLTAYRDRSARHDPLHTAALITELVARHRASARDWVPVLGTEEAARTPLRHLRLTGLGARITGDSESRTVETYLAHPEARIVLTLPVTAAIAEGAAAPTATALAARRTGTARLADLAAGNVVTESAVRSANRTVRLASSRVARTSVLPSTGDWSTLPPELLITDLDAEAARLTTLAPAVIRPRVHGASLRAVAVESIGEIRYLPGEQRLEATLHAPTGTATITQTHSAAAPGALDALAHTLSGDEGAPRYIAGFLHRRHGRLHLTPTAVVAGATVVVPCFADTAHAIGSAAADIHRDPLSEAVTTALALTAEVPHRGIRHLPPSWFTRAGETVAALRRVGLRTAATALDTLRHALGSARGRPALDLWVTTHLRLQLTADQL